MARWFPIAGVAIFASVAALAAPGCSGSRSAPAADKPAADKPAADKPAETAPGEVLAAKAGGALIGRRAPAGTIDLLGGDRVKLADLVGKRPIYLKFWATWCIPCREQMPHLEASYRKFGDRMAVYAVDLGVNDSIDAVRAIQAKNQLTVPIAIDGDGSLAEAYHVAVTPQHVLIDRTGVVRYVGNLASPELERALEAMIGDAPAGAPVPAVERPARPSEPADAPLALTLRDGKRFALADRAGAPVALTFVAEWCDGYLRKSGLDATADACAAHIRQVAALRASHPALTWVTIAHPVWTDPEDLDAFLQRFALTTPIGLDDGARWFHRFGVRQVATTILLDARGAELARVTGAGAELPAALAKLP